MPSIDVESEQNRTHCAAIAKGSLAAVLPIVIQETRYPGTAHSEDSIEIQPIRNHLRELRPGHSSDQMRPSVAELIWLANRPLSAVAKFLFASDTGIVLLG